MALTRASSWLAAQIAEAFNKNKNINTVVSAPSLTLESQMANELSDFRAKLGLPFDLISDGDERVCRLFDVIKSKNMYGKQVLGIERSTFLIDRQGVLRNEWRKVKADGHADAVLAAVRALN